jgi:hypothetical protein
MPENVESDRNATGSAKESTERTNGLGKGLATAAIVGVGAALIEIDWIPGVLLGVAAMAAPNLVPRLGRGIRPLVRTAVRTGYLATQRTREWIAEAGEQIEDMVAEARASVTEEPSGKADTKAQKQVSGSKSGRPPGGSEQSPTSSDKPAA